jgi:hypothetical protein
MQQPMDDDSTEEEQQQQQQQQQQQEEKWSPQQEPGQFIESFFNKGGYDGGDKGG